MHKTGVVVGKFYPFHRGHKFLIETALHHCEYVYVMVDDKPHYQIPAHVRAEWIRKSFEPFGPRVIVREYHNDLPDTDSKLWAEATIEFLGFVPDACVTSEDYGDTWAKEMGASHVVADKARAAVPISGTALRENMYGENFIFLEEHVRRHFVNTICIIGAESTGKTTLADGLGDALDIRVVREYGREYTEKLSEYLKENGWHMRDFEWIANMQHNMEKNAILRSNGWVILDTDAMATQAFCRRDMGAASAEVESLIRRQSLYIVTPLENPFEDDGWRLEEKRQWMHDYYIDYLKSNRLPYVEVHGTHAERMTQALEAIEKLDVPHLPVKVK